MLRSLRAALVVNRSPSRPAVHPRGAIYHDLIQEGGVWRADIELRTIGKLSGGGRTKRLDNNRYLIPADDTHAGLSGVQSVIFNANVISADLLRVEDINPHSGEIALSVCRVLDMNES